MTQEETDAIASKYYTERSNLTKMYDRARLLASKYDVPADYYGLIQFQPGEVNQFGGKITITDDLLLRLDDTHNRVMAAIENGPTQYQEFGQWLKTIFATKQDKNYIKWLVIVLVGVLILKTLGIDTSGIAAIIKALKG